MTADRPRLVIVSGAPGSGKTTLATLVAKEFGLPLLAKDRIKESLMSSLGVPDLDTNQRIGSATYDLLFAVTGWLLDALAGCVIESNFVVGQAEAALGPLVRRAVAVQIHCVLDEPVRRARYEARARAGLRHAGHLDDHMLTQWAERPASRHGPLLLDVPTLVVTPTRATARRWPRSWRSVVGREMPTRMIACRVGDRPATGREPGGSFQNGAQGLSA